LIEFTQQKDEVRCVFEVSNSSKSSGAESKSTTVHTPGAACFGRGRRYGEHPGEPKKDDMYGGALIRESLEMLEQEMLERSSVKVKASAEAARYLNYLHTEIAIQEGNVTRSAAAEHFCKSKKQLLLWFLFVCRRKNCVHEVGIGEH